MRSVINYKAHNPTQIISRIEKKSCDKLFASDY